jgi:tyrosyl-tRNA synthetase
MLPIYPALKVEIAFDALIVTGEIKRLIQGGGLYLNNEVVKDIKYKMRQEDIKDSKFCILRSGKKNFRVVLVQ